MTTRNIGAQTLEKGLLAFEALVENKTASLTKLSRQTGINKSTLYRYLATYKKMGYIAQDENDGYFLTDKLMKMASGVVPQMELRNLALPYLDTMAKVSKYNTNLGFWNGAEIVYLAQKRPHPLVGFSVGDTIPAYCSALGKAILAYLPHNTLEEYLKKTNFIQYSNTTPMSAEELIRDIEIIRKDGYALVEGEIASGLIGIAMPISIDNNYPQYAISIAGSLIGSIDNFLATCLPPLRRAALEMQEVIKQHHSVFKKC